MIENKVSAAAAPEMSLTKEQQQVREHRHRIRRAAHFFVHESKKRLYDRESLQHNRKRNFHMVENGAMAKSFA